MSRTPQKRPAYEPATRLLRPTGHDPHMARPVSVYAGVGLVLLRVIAGVVVLVGIALGWHGVGDLEIAIDGIDADPDTAHIARWAGISVGALFVLVDALFAIFVFFGRNAARIIVMVVSATSIASTFAAWWVRGQEIALSGTFVSLSLDILILLAFSSRSASAYSRRNERR